MKIQLAHIYKDIISLDNLLSAWQEFILGKKKKKDVQFFSRNLMDNILSLHADLANHTYRHGDYADFYITDPKRRHIHKASVRDRLVHHAISRILYPFFDKTFISDSFSCRKNKGMHRAINRFQTMAHKVSKNNTETCWVLKCDIKKFFDSIDHKILLGILNEYIPDKDIMWLLENVVMSFRVSPPRADDEESLKYCKSDISTSLRFARDDNRGVGLPLGNLTSQLFANVYMNSFDQWVKHKLKVKYYIRYADDFVILSENKSWQKSLTSIIQDFLFQKLNLTLHPAKIILKTYVSGVDFLGWVLFSNHRNLRAKTKQRMFRRLMSNPQTEVFQSYLGLLGHGDTYKIKLKLLSEYQAWHKREFVYYS